MTKRSRHFSIEWFKFRDLVENQELAVSWVSTDQNLADFFTKKLPRERFVYLRDSLMGDTGLQNYFETEKAKIDVVAKMCREKESEIFEKWQVNLVFDGSRFSSFSDDPNLEESEDEFHFPFSSALEGMDYDENLLSRSDWTMPRTFDTPSSPFVEEVAQTMAGPLGVAPRVDVFRPPEDDGTDTDVDEKGVAKYLIQGGPGGISAKHDLTAEPLPDHGRTIPIMPNHCRTMVGPCPDYLAEPLPDHGRNRPDAEPLPDHEPSSGPWADLALLQRTFSGPWADLAIADLQRTMGGPCQAPADLRRSMGRPLLAVPHHLQTLADLKKALAVPCR